MAKFSTQCNPERFINVGVAEQSMIGICCAGLALKGCQPFAYTIADLFALSAFRDGARRSASYQILPVTVVGMGAGVIYSYAGRHPSHYGRHRHRGRDPEHADHRALQIPPSAPKRQGGVRPRKTCPLRICASARPASRISNTKGAETLEIRQDPLFSDEATDVCILSYGCITKMAAQGPRTSCRHKASRSRWSRSIP